MIDIKGLVATRLIKREVKHRMPLPFRDGYFNPAADFSFEPDIPQSAFQKPVGAVKQDRTYARRQSAIGRGTPDHPQLLRIQ